MTYKYQLNYISNNIEQTEQLAKKTSIPLGGVVLLTGDLGSGKTTFVRGFAKKLNINEKVLSPTFNIMKLYLSGDAPLVHIDAYRLEDNNADIGLDEYIGIPNGYTFIEWPNYIKELLPEEVIEISIKNIGEDNREITIHSNTPIEIK